MATSLKTLRDAPVGKTRLRLLAGPDGYVGVLLPPGGAMRRFEGDDPEALWRKLLAEVGRAHPDYFGFDGAMARFRSYFPGGFSDPDYAATERAYKDQAVQKIGQILSLDQARVGGAEACAAAVRAFQATNLVFPVEKARIKDVLSGPQGDAFLTGAVSFAEGDVAGGLAAMIAAIKATSSASWPMLTYLPYLWRPDHHMFLKPQVTCDFADRVGHPFSRDYAQGLVPAVYDSLLDLAAETQREIAALAPRDLIDVQSFIWVVGACGPDDGPKDKA